jgi:hypothetical protein
MRVAQLMNSPAGRVARAVAGLALILAGSLTGGTGGLVLALIGLVPLAAGAAGVCVAAPLLRAPFRAR